MRKLAFLLVITLFMSIGIINTNINSFSSVQAQRGVGVNKTEKLGQKKIALVIGNSEYSESPLKNPVNDAKDIANTLQQLGFDVDLKLNTTKEVMLKAIQEFGGKIEPNSVAMFYYAGHGVQSNGENYLIPVGADIKKEGELQYLTINAGLVLAQMEGVKDTLNIVVLDACRNNPFARSFRSTGSGLAQMNASKGTVIMYATSPGKTASDGDGRNGLYTQELLKAMKVPGLKIEEVFKKVAQGVNKLSNDQQLPWISSNFFGEFSFTGTVTSPSTGENPTTTTALDKRTSEEKYWDEVDKTDAGELKAYLKKYPQGEYADLATSKIKKLEAVNTSSNTVPSSNNTANNNTANNSNASSTTPAMPAPAGRAPAPTMRSYNYETIVLDRNGSTKSQPKGQASYYVESLGSGIDLEMVNIQGGSYDMGDNGSQSAEFVNEVKRHCSSCPAEEWAGWAKPQHRVTVAGFYMGKYEVTQGQWKAIMGTSPSKFTGDNLPVEQVSWDEAVEFCRKLSDKTGREYRLPSEAEWEYAARAGTTSAYGLGDTITPSIVNYNGNYPYLGASKGEYREKTVRVGSFIPNAFGLYDMAGNVWEWCQDSWHDSYQGAPTDGAVWNAGADNSLRVLRGGSWNYDANGCRSSNRGWYAPVERYDNLGFRVVASARTLR